MHTEISSARPPQIFWPLLVLGIVLAADGATALVLHTTAQWPSPSLPIFYAPAPVAALLVGIPAWLHFIVTPGRATIKRGLLVGIVSSITAHPIMWLLISIPGLFTPQAAAALALPYYLLLVTFFSLIYGGWATTFVGATAGVLLIFLQRTLTRAQQQRASREAEAIQERELSKVERSGMENVHS